MSATPPPAERQAERDAVLAALTGTVPYNRLLGVRFDRLGDELTGRMAFREGLIGNPFLPALHGGVTGSFLEITALLDTACGWAVMAATASLKSTATLDLRIDYMRPATAGEAVFSRAECYRLTRSIGFARAVAYHSDPSDPVATAQGAFLLDRVADKGGVR